MRNQTVRQSSHSELSAKEELSAAAKETSDAREAIVTIGSDVARLYKQQQKSSAQRIDELEHEVNNLTLLYACYICIIAYKIAPLLPVKRYQNGATRNADKVDNNRGLTRGTKYSSKKIRW